MTLLHQPLHRPSLRLHTAARTNPPFQDRRECVDSSFKRYVDIALVRVQLVIFEMRFFASCLAQNTGRSRKYEKGTTKLD